MMGCVAEMEGEVQDSLAFLVWALSDYSGRGVLGLSKLGSFWGGLSQQGSDRGHLGTGQAPLWGFWSWQCLPIWAFQWICFLFFSFLCGHILEQTCADCAPIGYLIWSHFLVA